jgi:serine/threonine-protein kinase RsbW
VHVRVQLSLPRDASYVPVTRNVAHCLLGDMGVPDDAAGDIQVALSEACANVVRHAAGIYDYFVSLDVGPDGCEVEVVDTGPGFDPVQDVQDGQDPQVGTDAETGRGLLLMRALVDDFQFLREQDATRVRLIKRWPTLPAAP